jgi:hypothetical protein
MADDMEMHHRSKDSATSEVQDANLNEEKVEDGQAMNMNRYGRQRLDVRTIEQLYSSTAGRG